MKLAEFYGGIEIHREDKIVYVRLLVAHRVLSTCRSSAGGLHSDLMYLYNHQSREHAGNRINSRINRLAIERPDEYKRMVADRYHLPAPKCATLATAVNMNNTTICHERFCGLEVVTICTGGVEKNAIRSGDPAQYNEPQNGNVCLPKCQECAPLSGTINAMIFINQELTPGAMVTAIITATEAKTAALQELEVHSRYSEGLATGTGTDQIAVASKLGGKAIANAGKHSKLGELIGHTMHDAVKRALALENGLTPASQSTALAPLERFGIDEQELCQRIGEFLSKENAELFECNFSNIVKDPLTVAAVAALVHLRDKFVWGILPVSCIPEVMALYGAQISAAVSGKSHRIHAYMQVLSTQKMSLDKHVFLEFVCKAFAQGFCEKWSDFEINACKEKVDLDGGPKRHATTKNEGVSGR
ncbi:MAG: Adenosylcobinamide amidohydrolase [Methanosaeta sp. PtaU1.Bin060]|nr:MAG: Adenosylcobinamide amidohydrolase [Methanosaeta sp. PtaU1.Bin060]